MQDSSRTLNNNSKADWLAVAFLFMLLVGLLPGVRGFGQDNEFFATWASYTHEHGLRNAYGSGTDYLPVYQYVLWAFAKLSGNAGIIVERLHYLRIFALLFDFFGAYLIWKWLRGRFNYLSVILLTVGNIAYSYNSLIWGQIDAVWTVFSFAALYFAQRRKFAYSAVCMALALCTKLQAVIFIPLWGLCVLNSLFLNAPTARPKIIAVSIAGLMLIPATLLLPFMFGRDGLGAIIAIIRLAATRYPTLTLSADNLWMWHNGPASDNDAALPGISYKWLGIALFFICSLAAMLPLLARFVKNLRVRIEVRQIFKREHLWLSGALVSLLFFYCATEMHERYAHPAGIFLAAYALHTRRWGPYALYSVAYFLNLEVIMRWLALPNYKTFIFEPRFVSALYGILIIWLFLLQAMYFRDKKDRALDAIKHAGHE